MGSDAFTFIAVGGLFLLFVITVKVIEGLPSFKKAVRKENMKRPHRLMPHPRAGQRQVIVSQAARDSFVLDCKAFSTAARIQRLEKKAERARHYHNSRESQPTGVGRKDPSYKGFHW